MKNRYFAAIMLVLISMLYAPALSQTFVKVFGGDQNANPPTPANSVKGVPTQPAGQPAFMLTGNLSSYTGATAIDFGQDCTKVTVTLSPGSSNLYVNWNNGTPAAANGAQTEIFSGGSQTWVSGKIPGIKIISDGGTGKVSITSN